MRVIFFEKIRHNFMCHTTTLKLSYWHLGVWLALAVLAGILAVQICLGYNEEAGTDKTPGHIARIAAAVLIGPMTGPIANPGAGRDFDNQALGLTLILGTGVLLSLCPFLFIRRPVLRVACALCWLAFVAMSSVWFFASLVSLGHFLS